MMVFRILLLGLLVLLSGIVSVAHGPSQTALVASNILLSSGVVTLNPVMIEWMNFTLTNTTNKTLDYNITWYVGAVAWCNDTSTGGGAPPFSVGPFACFGTTAASPALSQPPGSYPTSIVVNGTLTLGPVLQIEQGLSGGGGAGHPTEV